MPAHTHGPGGPTERREAPQAVGPCPCDTCSQRSRCAAQETACAAYSMYFHGEPERRWRLAPRAASRAIFKAVFHGKRDPATYRGGRPRKVRVPDDGYRMPPLAHASRTQRVAWMLGRSRARIVRG